MEHLCRICCKQCSRNATYIHSSHDGVSVSEMLIKTCPIDITSDDPIGQLLPQSICNDCFEVISAAFNLQRVCIESDQYFRSMIGGDQVVVKTEKLECVMDIKEEIFEFPEYEDEDEEEEVDDDYEEPSRKVRKRNIAANKTTRKYTRKVKVKDESDDDEEDAKKGTFKPRTVCSAEKPSDIYYACNFCFVRQKKKKNILLHMSSKHNPTILPLYCNFCDSRFKDEAKKIQHEKTHCESERSTQILICELCGATGSRVVGMLHHKIDDHGIEDTPELWLGIEFEEDFKPVLVKKVKNFRPRVERADSESNDKDEVFYSCHFCDKRVKPKKTMLRHMRKHSADIYPFACEFCVMRFDTLEKLESHVQDSHYEGSPKETIFCDLCGASGDNKEGMQRHMEDDHSEKIKKRERMLKCPICYSRFPRLERLNNHLLKKHKQRTKCEQCDEEFCELNEKQHHVLMVHEQLYRELDISEIEFSFKCTKCDVEFMTQQSLMDHLIIHKSYFERESIKCLYCKRNMKDYDEFVEHTKYHTIPVTHECTNCKRRLPKDDQLLKHVLNHKRYECYRVECKMCNLKFPSEKTLENHVKVKHNNETLFVCPVCAKSLSSHNGLNAHIRYVHGSEADKKFQCKMCPAKFSLPAKLKKHEAIHSTERPHVCELCGSSFKIIKGLRKHMKTHDPNREKKHECSQCPMRFTARHRLAQHMLTHTGLKPHECKYCDKAYASKGDLVKHMQKLHVGDAVYQCEKCPRAFRLIIELREHQQEHATWIP